MSDVIEVLKASLGPGVAAMGVAVALAQWQTNRVKLRLDSYDRRLRVYKSVVTMLEGVVAEIDQRRGPMYLASNMKPARPYQGLPDGVCEAFNEAMLEAPFLFGNELFRFMWMVDRDRCFIQKSATLMEGQIEAKCQDAHHKSNRDQLRQCEKRARKSLDRVRTIFSPYLKLTQSRIWRT